LYMLGCDEYKDRDDNVHYLHNFSELCQESSVGCEVLIDTQNYTNYNSNIWYDSNINGACDSGEVNCVAVATDTPIYATYNEDRACEPEVKGCQALGEPYRYEAEITYNTKYLINNPDNYDTVLCTGAAVNCEEWTEQGGVSYFKDPGSMVCEWRQPYGQTKSDWYKKRVYRCDTDADGIGDGKLCQKDTDCVSGESCKEEGGDISCSTYNFKTIGYGGPGNVVDQPTTDMFGYNWTGTKCCAEPEDFPEYYSDENGLRSKVKEIRRLNPALVEFDLDTAGLPKNAHFLCPIHREKLYETPRICEMEGCKIDCQAVMYKYYHRNKHIVLFIVGCVYYWTGYDLDSRDIIEPGFV